jgi:sporulation protein YlmC with PRC-barrel domain
MNTLPLPELLGATVYDPSGAPSGRVRAVTLPPQEDRIRIASLIVKAKFGNRVLPFSTFSSITATTTKTFHDRTPIGLADALEFEGAVIDLCPDRNATT